MNSEPASQIVCPGCKKPLNLPPDAAGRMGTCPHCAANFLIGKAVDGSTTAESLQRFAYVGGVPRVLAGPGLALLMVAFVGLIVNGYLAWELFTVPGGDLKLARVWARSLFTPGELEQLRDAAKRKPGDPEPDPKLIERENEQIEAFAVAWAPYMRPVHTAGLVTSVIATLGAMCILRGRFFWFAVLACAAAGLNFNYLCCVPGAMAGLWAFLSLVRDESQTYFQRKSSG